MRVVGIRGVMKMSLLLYSSSSSFRTYYCFNILGNKFKSKYIEDVVFMNIIDIFEINIFSCKKSTKLFIKSPFNFRNNSIFLRFIYKYLFIIFQENEKPKNLIKIEHIG